MWRSAVIILSLLASAGCAGAQPRILPLSEVKSGMRGTGRTVFSGGTVEEFGVEILGVLENAGPGQSIILARLSGGQLDRTGLLQGMSGSPVYIDGRLAGAVALSFPFSKDPICGIRPIEEMLAVSVPRAPTPRAAAPLRLSYEIASALPKRQEVDLGPVKLHEIATPFWMSGFSRAAFEYFAPHLRAAGLEPVQGLSGGGRPSQPQAGTAKLEPGSMISVQLVTGDMNVGADGTATHIDGNHVYAFGHRFLSVGEAEFPFARAEVLTVVASQNMSFKISAPREWIGAMTEDRTAALAGLIGKRASMMPVIIRVLSRERGARQWNYRLEMVRDRLFTPLLMQMAIFSALDATERTTGLSTIAVRGRFTLAGKQPPVRFENLYSAELGAPQMVSAALAAPVVSLLQSGFTDLAITSIDLDLDVSNEKRQYQLEQLWASRQEARPGETVQIYSSFTGENNAEIVRTTVYRIPNGAPAGPLFFTVTDGPSSNLSEFRQYLMSPPRTASQLLEFVNGLRPNNRAYLRVWRQQPTWQVQGVNLPSVPPSLTVSLAHSATQQANSKVAEIEIPGGDFLLAGSKTIQVEVKE